MSAVLTQESIKELAPTSQDSPAKSADSESVMAGRALRARRKQRELEIADVSMHLMLREAQIRAMEAGQWQHLSGETYARGYIQRYAAFLGMENPLSEAPPQQAVAQKPQEVPHRSAPQRDLSLHGQNLIARPKVRYAMGVAFALFLALGLWALGSRMEDGTQNVAAARNVPERLYRYTGDGWVASAGMGNRTSFPCASTLYQHISYPPCYHRAHSSAQDGMNQLSMRDVQQLWRKPAKEGIVQAQKAPLPVKAPKLRMAKVAKPTPKPKAVVAQVVPHTKRKLVLPSQSRYSSPKPKARRFIGRNTR